MADTMNPNDVGIGPNGEIVVVGVELPEATGDPYSSPNSVGWFDASGVLREYLQGQAVADEHSLAAVAQADVNNLAEILISALVGGGAGDSTIVLLAKDSVGSALATALTSNGQSDFPQQETLTKRVYLPLAFSNLEWPGGGNATTYAFTHGQPTPAGALYFVTYSDGTSANPAYAFLRDTSNLGATIVVVASENNPAAGSIFGLNVLCILQY